MKIRVVVTYEEADFQVVDQYARAKSLEPKSFLKFATQAYMDKYPRGKRESAKAVQPYPIAGK